MSTERRRDEGANGRCGLGRREGCPSSCARVSASPRVVAVALCVFLGLLAPAPSGAEAVDSVFIVSRVTLEGHESFSTREILETVGIDGGAAVSPGEARRRLEDLLVRYRESGFPHARIMATWETEPGGRSELRLRVEEGARAAIEGISMEGCRGVPCPDLAAILETRTGSVLRRGVFLGDVNRLLDEYENRGYPYARILPRARWTDRGGMQLDLTLVEGPRVVIDGIRVFGNEATRSSVVERECGVAAGDLYSQRKIDRVRSRLMRLGFFDEVETAVSLEDSSGRGFLDIHLKERKTNSVFGAVGYVPRETEKGYLAGVLDLSFGNISGTGRSARVRWRTYQPGAFEWTFSYGEPWILGVPLTGLVSIHQEVRDSTFTRTVGEVGIEYPLGDRLWGKLVGRSEGVTAGAGGRDVIRGSRRRSLDAGLGWDGRDDPLNPGRGFRTELGVEYGRKRYEGQGDDPVRVAVYRLRGDLFVPLARRHVLALVSSLFWLDSSEHDIPEHEQFRVGGAESLRGYAEDVFYGWRVFTVTTEYRVLLGRRSRFHLFVDGAHLDRRLPPAGGTVDQAKRLFGYGFGLRSESRLGMIGVDFGLASGEPPTEGKIHVRVEGEF